MEMAYWSLQPIARFLIFCRVTPNQLSWTSLFFGSITGLVLAFGHFGFGACFSTISGMLDILDGMVARTLGTQSDAGEVLDASVDRYVEFFFFIGLAAYYHLIPTFLVLVLLAMMGSFMVSYSTAKAEALGITPPRGSMRRPERALYLVLGAALSPWTISWLETERNTPVAIAHPMIIMLCMVAVVANFSALERLYAIAQLTKQKKASLPLPEKTRSI
jgi:phosphatidylglycerophosphate synthase